MMNLREVVERYKALANASSEAVPLEAFGLPPDETVRLFSVLDEDYHISRFLDFSFVAGSGKQYSISGNAISHVRIDPGIEALL
jgi:hypothetical protein